MRRLAFKSVVKGVGLTNELPLILDVLSTAGAGGICDVAVKCIDITRNTSGEGDLLGGN